VPITSFVSDHANTAAVINGNFIELATGIPLQHVRTDGIVRYPSVVDAHDEGAVVINAAGDADTVLRPTTAGKWDDRPEPDIMASNVPLWDEGVKYTLPNTAYYTVDRHPRTAVGRTSDNKFLFVVVDGRRTGAAGMTLTELQTLFEGLGATDGLNMDGGGSSAMWVKGEPGNGIVNVPSDGFVRSVTDGLSIIAPGAATPVEWDGRLDTLTASPSPARAKRTPSPLSIQTSAHKHGPRRT
jgi:exopolysaccharide biosynthesis protein